MLKSVIKYGDEETFKSYLPQECVRSMLRRLACITMCFPVCVSNRIPFFPETSIERINHSLGVPLN